VELHISWKLDRNGRVEAAEAVDVSEDIKRRERVSLFGGHLLRLAPEKMTAEHFKQFTTEKPRQRVAANMEPVPVAENRH